MTRYATVDHVRRAGYCMRGVRRWLQGREYGWRDLIERGIPTDWLRATGDLAPSLEPRRSSSGPVPPPR
jgi:hypothetical protein